MTKQPPMLQRILLNVGIVVVFLTMLGMGALPKLLPIGPMAADTRTMFTDVYGLPLWFATVTGVLELLAAILVLLPRGRPWGGLLTGCIMVGAMVVNIRAGELQFIAVNLVILAAAVLVVWPTRRAFIPGQHPGADTP